MTMLTFFSIYLFCGLIIGFIAGLFGIGGGIIGIPILLLLFKLQGMSQSTAMHMAIGTSFATVVVTSFASLYAHHRKKMILFSMVKKIVVGSVLGTILGTMISTHIHGLYLQIIFGFFLILIAIQMGLQIDLQPHTKANSMTKIFFVSTSIGLFSSMLGLGGGILMVPYLHSCGVPMRNAIATATACIIPAAIVGVGGYMLVTNQETNFSALHTGFVYWPAFLGLSIASVCTAPLGIKLAHSISIRLLKRIFSLFLFSMGIFMLYTSLKYYL